MSKSILNQIIIKRKSSIKINQSLIRKSIRHHTKMLHTIIIPNILAMAKIIMKRKNKIKVISNRTFKIYMIIPNRIKSKKVRRRIKIKSIIRNLKRNKIRNKILKNNLHKIKIKIKWSIKSSKPIGKIKINLKIN